MRVLATFLLLSLTLTSGLVHAMIPDEAYEYPTTRFTQVLSQSVVDGHVNYAFLAESDQLEAYWHYVSSENVDRFESEEETLAFYINAYNALSIKGILKGRSPKNYFGKIRFFYSDKYDIAGERINLYNFEHKVIRPLGEPRIHFALVCSANSCPKLRPEAYTAATLDRQLDENTIEFINDQSKNWFDTEEKVAHLSKIFDWFTEDFTADGLSLQQYIAQYVSDDKVAALLREDAFKIKYNKYDWGLNGSFDNTTPAPTDKQTASAN